MSVQVFWFSEEPYSYVDEDLLSKHQTESYFTLSNKHFDPEKAHGLYKNYYEQYRQADEVGFDGIMTNEHHNSWWCMKPSANISAAALISNTKNTKIAILGNIIPVTGNPVKLAEEIAMLDVMSGGRIISGFVRGGPVESIHANLNPADNMERFQEAHDLIIKTWTSEGPFRWEGKHFHHRIVNPWMKPLQQPHPTIWYPGTSSVESVVWAAERGYAYMSIGSTYEVALATNKLYHETAAKAGHETGPEQYGFLIRACVADTDEAAFELGRHFMWNEKHRFRGPMEHFDPPGYRSRESAKVNAKRVQPGFGGWSYENLVELDQIIVGNPDTVVRKLRKYHEELGAGNLIIYGQEGPMPHRSVMRSIELWGREVIPALKG